MMKIILSIKRFVRFKMWLTIALGVALGFATIILDPNREMGWVLTKMIGLSGALVSSGVWYFLASRAFAHVRTHELEDDEYTVDQWLEWQRWLLLSTAIVFGLCSIP